MATKFTIVDRRASFGGPGTQRAAAWGIAKRSRGSIATYLQSGGPRRYLARWQAMGLIALR